MDLFHHKTNPTGTVYKDVVFGGSLAKQDDDADDDTIEFDVVASDESVDRVGDIIRADGWDFESFRANNIVLRQHNSREPVGTAPKLWQEGLRTLATIRLADAGSSQPVDDTRSLVSQRVLKAVSVGFIPHKWAFLESSDRFGIEFIEQELTEISIVSVPANANALAVARAFDCDDRQHDRINALVRAHLEQTGLAQPRAHRPRLLAARHKLAELV